MGKDQ